MLNLLFEIILQIVIEAVVGLVGEAMGEIGVEVYQRSGVGKVLNPIGQFIWYAVLGALFGLLSCVLGPGHSNLNITFRIATWVLSSVLFGLTLCFITWVISGRIAGERIFRWDKFVGGVVFYVAYSLSRNLILKV